MQDLSGIKVTFFPYRTARVIPQLVSLPRAACSDWEKELARLAGNRIDNHTVYKVESRNTETVYVWFTDLMVHMGPQLHEDR